MTSKRVHLIAVNRLPTICKSQATKFAIKYNHYGNVEIRLNEYTTSINRH